MSIIEKALEKLRTGGKPSADAPTSVSAEKKIPIPEKKASLVESAVADQIGDFSNLSLPESDDYVQTIGIDKTATAKPDVTIDVERLDALGMITPTSSKRSKIAEEYRLIKRPLLDNVANKGAAIVENVNLIAVTSSLPGEGKTFTAINLAMSIASEKDKTVLLVDADVAKPSVMRLLGIKAEKGLTDYLLGEVNSLSDVLLKTDIPNLTILPAGKRDLHSTELLASENMRMLLQEISSRYPDRIIIFDSPPLLATSEASVLANQMGQIIVVVEAGSTSQDMFKEAIALVDPEMIIGLVLNKSGQAFGTDYYGSYSYYGHSQS